MGRGKVYWEKSSLQGIGAYLLALYIGTAPVYWVPGLSPSTVQLLKLLLVSSGCLIIWYDAIQENHHLFPKGLVGPLGLFLVILSSFTGIIRAESVGAIVRFLVDFSLGFILLWTLYIFTSSGGSVVRLLRNATLLILLLAIPGITNWFIGMPDLTNPWGFDLWFSGFGSLRSDWSRALSLYLPISVAFLFFFRVR